jgi:hypothetical protein
MIENAILISFLVYFLKVTTWEGMIFEKVGAFTERVLGEYWNKPVLGCPICMTPWWGSGVYLAAHFLGIPGFEDARVQMIVMTVLVAAGFSSVVLMFNKMYDEAKDSEKLIEKKLENESNNKESKERKA